MNSLTADKPGIDAANPDSDAGIVGHCDVIMKYDAGIVGYYEIYQTVIQIK